MEKENIHRPHAQLIYGDAMQQAVASGDLIEMKKLAARAQQHLTEYGDVSAALEMLKIEIAKLEDQGK